MLPLSWYFHYDTDKIAVTVNPSFGNIAHVWVSCYFSSALLCTLRMILSGPLIEGYNCTLTEFVTLSALLLYVIDCNSAIPSLTAASSTGCQLLTHLTNQELGQRASESPATVPPSTLTDTFLVTVLMLSVWWGLSTPDHSSSIDDPLSKADLQEAGFQGLQTDCLTGPCYW